AAVTTGELILVANPDTVASAGSVSTLRDFVAAQPRCGAAGPQMLDPDGRWQPSRRRFPTVGGTLVRRTPLRRVFPPLAPQPTPPATGARRSRFKRTGCWAGS